jgi:hypothetical protein
MHILETKNPRKSVDNGDWYRGIYEVACVLSRSYPMRVCMSLSKARFTLPYSYKKLAFDLSIYFHCFFLLEEEF